MQVRVDDMQHITVYNWFSLIKRIEFVIILKHIIYNTFFGEK